MRAIDGERLMELLKEQYLHHNSIGSKQITKAWQGAMQLLYDMPTITPPNEPLTIEQLREMDGEPVWIERIESDSPNDREWALVFCEEKFCRTSCGNIALFGCYGIGWLAYRRPPEG